MSLTVLSPGTGYGKVHQIHKNNLQYSQTVDAKYEVTHFLSIKQRVYQKLENLKNQSTMDDIITFQQAILNDQLLENEVKTKIKTKDITAKQALNEAMTNYIHTFETIEDAYLKERVDDLIDLKERLSNALDEVVQKVISEPIILVCDLLYPSYLFEYESHIQGIIVQSGSALSHGVILAKERNIPCIELDTFDFDESDYIFLDTEHQQLLVNPDKHAVIGWLSAKQQLDSSLDTPHFPKRLFLNVSGETPLDPRYIEASDGIGLYRSEFLYFQYNRFPSIDKQVDIYGQFLKQCEPKPVVIRTYDFGDDKNPLNLGPLQRGVSDYFITYEKPFIEQLSALLVLNETYDNLKVMIPMVKRRSDVDAVIQLMKNLQHKFGFSKTLPPVGVMIETEEAFMHLDEFSTVDFISIGSNDLGKSLFHIDRHTSMDEVAYANQMVKAIEEIDQFAKHHQISCTVCGDIASRPYALSKMLERQINSFSIPMPFLKEAKQIIKQNKNKNMKS